MDQHRWAGRLDYVQQNPASRVQRLSEKGRERETYLTSDEARAFIESAEPALRPLLTTALLTGMRRGEMLALRWPAVDFDNGLIIVEAQIAKTARSRSIPMTNNLERELKALRPSGNGVEVSGSAPVFVRPDGSPMTVSSLRSLFTRARERCQAIAPEKRGKITCHTLRHTAASLLAKVGVPLLDISRILGHASIQTTLRYVHLTADGTREAVERLGKIMDSPHGPRHQSAARRSS